MRCKACDCELTDVEAVRKSPNTGDYYDLCTNCLSIVMKDLYPDSWDEYEYMDEKEIYL